MKCPQCGRWNRATLEKCFYCGAPLPQPDAQSASIWRSENSDVPKPPSTVIYSVENDDRTVPRPDERDLLAGEMQSLHTRRKRGEEQQRRAEAGGKTGEPARERHIHAAGRRQRERQMCGGRKAARSAAAIGERREIERGETERRKQ